MTNSVRSTGNDAIVTFGEDRRIEAANPAAEGLLLYGPNELLGRDMLSLLPRECELPFLAAIQSDDGDGIGIELETPRPFRLLRKDGHSVAVQATIAPMRFDRRVLWTLLAQDNTSHDRATTQWELMERLAAIGQAVSTIAHESRNSLQRMEAAVHQLKKHASDAEKVQGGIAKLASGTQELHRLHETVLEFVRPRVLQPISVDARSVVRAAWQEALTHPDMPHVELVETQIADDTTCEIDAFAVRQVFRNIFENSLAACACAPEIKTSYVEAEILGVPALRIVVRDNGPGLSEEQRNMVFVPFYTTKQRGLGLGLTIARQIVEAHGGEIYLADGPGTAVAVVFKRNVP
ncbi:MAG TPA: ATP-binding protein [Planctomycetaceae bacterium]|nr:ATP-binding protein [Planctomycetaceae bacterium]